MKRRSFLKLMTQVGLATSCYPLLRSAVFAASDNYQGPLWLIVNADGGWDVTSLCDPKGYAGPSDAMNPERINNYDNARIRQVGNLRYAPPPDSFMPGGVNFSSDLFNVDEFYAKYYQRMLVINGLDSRTISHNDGQLFNLSGQLIPGFPCFAALVASSYAPQRPLAFISNGGYSATADLITPVKLSHSSLSAIYEIAYPNRSVDPRSPVSRTYYPASLEELVENTSIARHQAMLNQQYLPRVQVALSRFMKSRSSVSQLQAFAENLEQIPEFPEIGFNGRKSAFELYRQGRIALAAYQEGVAVSANITLSGFDSHSHHDASHYPLLMDLLQGVDAILRDAENRGLSDRLVIVMTSDFGRSNRYNAELGKDHWPISSAILMGNSFQQIKGNRVIGATDASHMALSVDPQTLMPDFSGTNPSAIRITPAHLHKALRQLAGVELGVPSLNFPINVENLNLFL